MVAADQRIYQVVGARRQAREHANDLIVLKPAIDDINSEGFLYPILPAALCPGSTGCWIRRTGSLRSGMDSFAFIPIFCSSPGRATIRSAPS
jgi:hypothetical protein